MNQLRGEYLVIAGCLLFNTAYANSGSNSSNDAENMLVTADDYLKTQPGVSVITKKEIEKSPVVNDLSEIISKTPGINLSSNSTSGARGNNRQIDIRGMGPENTLILIDGVPATSRNAIRYSWEGERDTRGDSNWVPAELVERIEIIRGTSAAKYGSGASGGVINIITKKPTDSWQGTADFYSNIPEDKKEGSSRRANFSLSGGLIPDVLSMRLYGNINKTDADDWSINKDKEYYHYAGREGVRNKDVNALFSLNISPSQRLEFNAAGSRQGNIFTGDSQLNGKTDITELLGKKKRETNRMYRQVYTLSHYGFWEWGQSLLSASTEKTKSSRLEEGLGGRSEGQITDPDKFDDSRFTTELYSAEFTIPVETAVPQTFTLRSEYSTSKLNDPASANYDADLDINFERKAPERVLNVSSYGNGRSGKSRSDIASLYADDLIQVTDGLRIIPGVRYDNISKFGNKLSPSLNLQYDISDKWIIKTGIAQAFKTPNLYQMNEGYLLYSFGAGCPFSVDYNKGAGCYLVGSDHLKPETSLNKEIGIQFSENGINAGLTYFHNDYKNKIAAGTDIVGKTQSDVAIIRWQNIGNAVIQGIEASASIPFWDESLRLNSNATYMIENKDKKTGNELSIIPEYTVNTRLEWDVNSKLTTSVNWSLYGPQKPVSNATTWYMKDALKDENSHKKIASYSVFGAGVTYSLNDSITLKAGVSNILDKKLNRTGMGAQSYNNPGRAFYAGVSSRF